MYIYIATKKRQGKGEICNMSVHDSAILPFNAYDSMLGSHMRQR